MASRAAEPVAGIVDRIEGRPYRTGRPPLPTVEVVEASRYFVREGVRWRELQAAAGRACGPTPRRGLDERGAAALPRGAPVSPWSGWCARDPRPPLGTSWSTAARPAPSRAASRPAPTRPTGARPGPGTTSWSRPTACRRASCPRPPTSTTPGSSRACRGGLRRHRQALRRRGLRQRGEPRPSPAGRHPALHPAGRRAARLGARHRPPPGGARLRLAAGRQAAGPAAGQAGPGDPGAPDRRLHLRRREPPRPVPKTVP